MFGKALGVKMTFCSGKNCHNITNQELCPDCRGKAMGISGVAVIQQDMAKQHIKDMVRSGQWKIINQPSKLDVE